MTACNGFTFPAQRGPHDGKKEGVERVLCAVGATDT